jgi:hypothetical protein
LDKGKSNATYFGDSSLYARNDDNATDDNTAMDVLTLYKKRRRKKGLKTKEKKTEIPGQARG